jgi:hypothetical protein
MKSKRKNKLWRCLFLFFAGISSATTAQETLYIYAPGNTVQSFELDNIRKITFTEQNIQVHPTSGNVASLLFDNVETITFEPKGMTFIAPIMDFGVELYFYDGCANIKSSAEITTLTLYNMQGNLLQRTSPQSLSASLPLQRYPAGVYIIQVVNTQGISTHKIIKH